MSKQTPEPMETVVLEKTIIKIGSLLALGFGEAGAEIIGHNMKWGDSSALNAMIPGRRVEAIFGFCDIRNFTDATEVLQDQVMVFVNRIAGVVHSCISEFFGSPNKNTGDAFLLAWRLSGHNESKQRRLADMALISFIKIIAQINKSPLLAEYRNHPKLVKRLPNYRVRMGFGLHSGWAIEGAIGSEFKIDASYLSPNVNMASKLEAVTKSYGCLILMSESLHKLMTEVVAEECRLIDRIKIGGTREPFKLYTLDLDDLALEVERVTSVAVGKNAKFKQRYEKDKKKKERWHDDFKMHTLFEQDEDILTMRHKFSIEFFCRFNMAYLNYEAGEWEVAKQMLDATRFLLATEDGPSAALLRFLKQNDWETPSHWQGYRVLKDK
jgi:class 3 adenylate cyclase